MRPKDPGVQLGTHLTEGRMCDDSSCVRLLQRPASAQLSTRLFCKYTNIAPFCSALARPHILEANADIRQCASLPLVI